MTQLMVKHRVQDYDNWKRLFDDSKAIRKLFGEKQYKIFRNTADPNDVSVLFEWENPQKAIKYAQSDELRAAMKLAGVLEDPVLY